MLYLSVKPQPLTVISPDLVREVEARMNRNYMPPSLVQMPHQYMMATANTANCSNNNNGSNSPPTSGNLAASVAAAGSGCSNSSNASGGGVVVARRFGRGYHKLPTVQEVGKLWQFFFCFFLC